MKRYDASTGRVRDMPESVAAPPMVPPPPPSMMGNSTVKITFYC